MKKTWLQYRLRTLILVSTFGCIGLGWFVESARRQSAAVQEVCANGGWVGYRHDSAPFNTRNEIRGRTSFETTFGKDWFRTVIVVGCVRDEGSSQVALAVKELPHVTRIELMRSEVGDYAIEQFAKLKGIRSLSVLRTGLTDEGVKSISEMTSLESLAIETAAITDNSLRALDDLPHLTHLNVANCKISAVAVKAFGSRHNHCAIYFEGEDMQEGQ